jgi:murein L,D-transpeptidase YafK
MKNILLNIADILLYLLLVITFFFLYVNPPSYTHLYHIFQKQKTFCSEKFHFEGTLPLPTLDLNDTMTFDDLTRIGQVCQAEEYMIKENIFLTQTLEQRLSSLSLTKGTPVFIRIFKEEAILEVWVDTGAEYKHLKDYIICAASGHLGPKIKEGDRQSPEGFYQVGKKHLNPNSKFHLSFNLGYPNAYDRAHKRTGSFLMVHGNCVSIGCYAMTDEKIEEIYALVESALNHGQNYVDVHAYPFRMTKENMDLYEGNIWYDFWTNLKEGYDYFELTHRPPMIKVKAKRYEIYE